MVEVIPWPSGKRDSEIWSVVPGHRNSGTLSSAEIYCGGSSIWSQAYSLEFITSHFPTQ